MSTEESVSDVKLKTLQQDVTEIKGSLNLLSIAINKLALIEDRQSNTAEALNRAFLGIDALAARLQKIELSLPELKLRTSQAAIWVDRAIWGVISGGGVYLLNLLGVFN